MYDKRTGTTTAKQCSKVTERARHDLCECEVLDENKGPTETSKEKLECRIQCHEKIKMQ